MTNDGEWQPIGTAPNSRIILLFAVTDRKDDGTVSNWRMGTGYKIPALERDESGWLWEGRILKTYDIQPTHWMPLPKQPK